MAANTGFRLGEEQFSDESDGDQSQTSQQSTSPRRANGQVPAQKSKKKKKKDRRKIGALADELVDVLGDAFSVPNPDARISTDQHLSGDQSMVVDAEFSGKKMSKRTRQNLAKMQARKERNSSKMNTMNDISEDKTLQAQLAAAERRGMSLEEYRKLGTGKGMSKASARRAKKDARRKERAAAAAAVDEMDIG
ncbi:lactose permease [Stemphylium lycopersici]|nr:lactose permease [Stemphylium lycopersici]